MGFTPAQVGEMSPWHFAAALRGFKMANSPPSDTVKPPTFEEHQAAVEFAQNQTIH